MIIDQGKSPSKWDQLHRFVPVIVKGNYDVPPFGVVVVDSSNSQDSLDPEPDSDEADIGPLLPVKRIETDDEVDGHPGRFLFNGGFKTKIDRSGRFLWNQPCLALMEESGYASGDLVRPQKDKFTMKRGGGSFLVLSVLEEEEETTGKEVAWVLPPVQFIQLHLALSPSVALPARVTVNSGTAVYELPKVPTGDGFELLDVEVVSGKKQTKKSGRFVKNVLGTWSEAIGTNKVTLLGQLTIGDWVVIVEDCDA